MKDVVLAHLENYNLQESPLVVMVSGGVDSMVLLHLLQQCVSIDKLFVFHLNHNTRTESNDDALFVQNYCSKNNISCQIDILEASPETNKEAFWRSERQQRSQAFATKVSAQTILTAHHATDLVETMLYRVTKGCGIDGLSPFETSTKPLHTVSKQEILEYAKVNQLEWKEDSTNTDTDYARNNIRQNVLPKLREITPNLEQVFGKESELFAEMGDFIEHQVLQIIEGKNSLPLPKFLHLHPFLQKSVLYTLSGKNSSQNEVRDCLKWLQGKPQGCTSKNIGKTKFWIEKNVLSWELVD